MRVFELVARYVVSLAEAKEQLRSLGVEFISHYDPIPPHDLERVIDVFAANYEVRKARPRPVNRRQPCSSCGG